MNKVGIVYITRNGLLEPLGQSQVLSYLRGLSTSHRITLITYEKEQDACNAARMAEAREECEAHGINWLPQRFRSRPSGIAPALSMIRMVWLLLRQVRQQNARLMHARSYIPATVALIVTFLTKVPFIFDMRALWPEELITAGRLRRGSWLHKSMVVAESACLRHAAGVVSLTRSAVDHLQEVHDMPNLHSKTAVIPTCADLSRFTPATETGRPSVRVIGCIGTVLSGWFKTDWLVKFFAVGARQDPTVRFQLVTLDDHTAVRDKFEGEAALLNRIDIRSCRPSDMHKSLHGHMASVMFFTSGIGKLGSSPTRMGEALGCGLPIVANEGVGDVARIIREYRVGVIVEGGSDAEMYAAWIELEQLLQDPELATRCRQAAITCFSLESGVAAYRALYDRSTVRQ